MVLLFASKVRQHDRETSAALPLFQQKQPPRVRAMIGFEKPVPFLHREMADLYDGMNVLSRDRRLICRVGNLSDEAAVLAERFGQTLAHARRSPIEHVAKDSLVGSDQTLRFCSRCLRAHAAAPE